MNLKGAVEMYRQSEENFDKAIDLAIKKGFIKEIVNPNNELIYCIKCKKKQNRYKDGICADCFKVEDGA